MESELLVQIPFTDLPEGTVTFLFTDIEGSTQLLHRLHDRYAILLEDHHRILRNVFSQWNGQEIDTQGDAFFVAFSRATQAVGAAAEAQRMLAEHIWPERVELRVRMGIHTGESWTGSEGYVGINVVRAARIAHVGNGGQVLLSETTAALVRDDLPSGVTILDLGRHLLKDIHRPERISQLVIEGLPAEFPPLTSLEILPADSTRQSRKVGDCPYRGLAAFKEEDAQFYFGREKFIYTMEKALNGNRLVAVIVGSSGSGKSSALFAGLLPRLRKTGGYKFITMRPGNQPFFTLAGALIPYLENDLNETSRLIEMRHLAEAMIRGDASLQQVTQRILEKHPDTRKILFVVDQFEELYTLCTDTIIQKKIIDELLAVVAEGKLRHGNKISVLLNLRADFMGQALAYRPFADALQEASMMLGPMNQDELHMAIEKPAEIQGAAFEPGLVERILDDVGEEPGNLPLLEFTLTQLWEHQVDGWLTHAEYEAIGCVDGALATYANRVFEQLDEDERNLSRRALVQLVQPGEGTEDTRRIATREEIGDACWQLLQHLADMRLVVVGRDVQGHETAEVVHEALIQRWDRLQEWMDADRAFREWQERLRANLRQWQESGHDEATLLAGAPLAVAEGWLVERPSELNPAESAYIQTSQALQTKLHKERQRRRRWTFAGLSIGLIIALALAAVAMIYGKRANENAVRANQNQATAQSASILALKEADAKSTQQAIAQAEAAKAQAEASSRATAEANAFLLADIARARGLAMDAASNSEVSPQLSILLALQSASLYKSLGQAIPYDLQSTLHQAILASRVRLAWSSGGETILSIKYIQPGDIPRVVTLNREASIVSVWDPVEDKRLLQIPVTTSFSNPASLSEDGKKVAVAVENSVRGDDNIVMVYDISTGEVLRKLDGYSTEIRQLNFDADGKRLLTTDLYLYRLREIESGVDQIQLDTPESGRYAVLSRDGQQMAAVVPGDMIEIIDIPSGKAVTTIRLERYLGGSRGGGLGVFASEIINLAFNSQATRLAGVGWVGGSVIWDARSGEKLASFDISHSLSSQGQIEAMAYSPDGSKVALPGMIYAADTGMELLALPELSTEINQLEFNHDGTRLITANNNQSVQIVDLTLSREVMTLSHPSGEPIYGVAFSPDGKWLVTTGADQTARVWDFSSGGLTHTLEGHIGTVNNVAFSSGGDLMATAGADGKVFIWDTNTWEQLRVLSGHTTENHGSVPGLQGVVDLEFSPQCGGSFDGQQTCDLASVSMDGKFYIWDAYSVRNLFFFQDIAYKSVAFPPDGTYVFVGGEISGATGTTLHSGDKWVTGLWLGNIAKYGVWDSAFSPDGEKLALIDYYGMIRVWMVYKSGKWVNSNFSKFIQRGDSLAYDPTGSYLATAGSGIIRLWNADSMEPLFDLTGHEPVTNFSIAFSPDGKYLASASFDGTVRVYVIPSEDLLTLARSRVTRRLNQEECQQFLHVEQCPATP